MKTNKLVFQSLFLSLLLAGAGIAQTPLQMISKLDGGTNPFKEPISIALDPQGNLYVADSANHRIQKFDGQGKLISKWGGLGQGNGQLNCQPYNFCAVAVDSSGHVYVTDGNNNRVVKFDSSGKFLSTWGSTGYDNGQFTNPFGLGVDRQGNVYVSDDNHRIQKFDANGKFLAKWGGPGSGDGEFGVVIRIAFDTQGNIFVTDMGNGLQKFDANGKFLTKYKTCGNDPIIGAMGLALDAQDNLYVFELLNKHLCKFDSSGRFVTLWEELKLPGEGIAIDQQGNMYVAQGGGVNLVIKYRKP
jgi:tripartite motif-containing protein 71